MTNQVIMWILSIMAVVMTGVGGSAASHLISQIDSLAVQVNVLSIQIATIQQSRNDTERRLVRIEDKVDLVSNKQRILESVIK